VDQLIQSAYTPPYAAHAGNELSDLWVDAEML